MTDAVMLGTAQADAPGQPAPVDTSTPAVQADAPVPATSPDGWLSDLDEDTRKFVIARGAKSPADAAKQLREQIGEVTRLQQEAIRPPKDDAPQEEWDKFHARLGRPEKADGYQFKLPESLPKDLPYDEGFAAEFKNWAHGAGLAPRQAQALHDGYVAFSVKQAQAQAAHYDQLADASSKDLAKAWGEASSPEFQKNIGVVQRVIADKGDEFKAALTSGPIMDAQGRVSNSAIVRLIAELAADRYTNDRVISGSPAPGREIPLEDRLYPSMKK